MAETINNTLFLQQNQLLVAGDLHVHTGESKKTQTETNDSEFKPQMPQIYVK